MESNNGWVKLYRDALEDPLFADDRLWKLWTYCFATANHSDAKWLIPGTTTEIIIRRGSFVTGQFELHKALYPVKRLAPHSSATSWRLLHGLCKKPYIKLENLQNRATLVSVCNYTTYQGEGSNTCKAPAKPMQNRCKTDAKHMQTIEECKEEEERKEVGGKPQSRFVPPSVPEVAAYCSERGNAVDPEKFVDHYSAKGWMIGKNKMKDWRAAVRTWEPPKPKSKCPDFNDLLKPGAIQ